MVSLQKDVVHLSNTGPAISGSEIVFKAEVSDGTSHPVHDEKYFEYHWENTANYLKTTTRGYKNTTQKSCYGRSIPPEKYKMSVRVWDMHDEGHHKLIGKAESYFIITAQLNGKLNTSQELKYREPDASQVYSTKKPIKLHLNLTDRFTVTPSMDYSWFLDGAFLMDTNNPVTVLPVHDPGEHTVTVKVKTVDKIPDCDGFSNWRVLKGQFNETIILKDPVAANVTGADVVQTTVPIVINVTLNGSDPFMVCWKSNQTSDIGCIVDWCCENLTDVTDYNITIWNQTAGNYSFNISISNDISIVYKKHNVSVTEPPPPEPHYHSAAEVVLPVIAGLVAVCFTLAVVIYVMKVRKKKRVEVADFNFHPSITNTERSLVTNIKYVFQRMFQRNNYEQTHRYARYTPPKNYRYGSMDETEEKQSLLETL